MKKPPGKNSIWSNVNKSLENQDITDSNEIAHLFAVSKPHLIPKGSSRQSNSVKHVQVRNSILEFQRSNNLEIMLAGLKLSPEQILSAIIHWGADDSKVKISLDSLLVIQNFLPTQDETKKLIQWRTQTDINTDSQSIKELLRPAELYFYHLILVPRLRPRLECWLFRCQFYAEEKTLEESPSLKGHCSAFVHKLLMDVSKFRRAISEIKQSEKLKKLLAMLLSIGRILNDSNIGSVTWGFELDCLLSLDQLKTDPSVFKQSSSTMANKIFPPVQNLLQYLVHKADNSNYHEHKHVNESAMDYLSEMPSLLDLHEANINFEELKDRVSLLKNQVSKLESELKHARNGINVNGLNPKNFEKSSANMHQIAKDLNLHNLIFNSDHDIDSECLDPPTNIVDKKFHDQFSNFYRSKFSKAINPEYNELLSRWSLLSGEADELIGEYFELKSDSPGLGNSMKKWSLDQLCGILVRFGREKVFKARQELSKMHKIHETHETKNTRETAQSNYHTKRDLLPPSPPLASPKKAFVTPASYSTTDIDQLVVLDQAIDRLNVGQKQVSSRVKSSSVKSPAKSRNDIILEKLKNQRNSIQS